MINFEIKGLDDFKRKIDEMKTNAEKLSGEHKIPFKDLFNSDFLIKYTDFKSLDEMFHADEFVIESEDDFKKVPDDKWDEYIGKHTRFSNWQEMMGKASEEYFARKLGLK